MPTAKVILIQGGKRLHEDDRPLRRLPTGGAGVLVAGMVYPIGEDRQVNLDGECFYPGDCHVAVLEDDEIDFSDREGISQGWILERREKWTALHLLGEPDHLEALVNLLSENGSSPSVWGSSWRDAKDGRRYNWIILFQENDYLSKWTISSLVDEARQRKGEYGVIDRSLLELGSRLGAAEETIALLEERLTELEITREKSIAQLLDESALLRAAIEAHRNASKQTKTALERARAEVEKTKKEHKQLVTTDEFDEVITQWEKAEENSRAAREDLAKAQERMESLEKALEHTKVKSAVRPSRVKRQASVFSGLFGGLAQNLNFIGGSFSFMAEDVLEPKALAHLLGRLNEHRIEMLPSKKVNAAEGWWECHFSTGQNDDGRLYFRHIGNKQFEVLVSDKAAQGRDFSWLKKRV